MCVDCRDLNKTSPKNDLSLSYIDILVDNAAKKTTYFFMDCFSKNN